LYEKAYHNPTGIPMYDSAPGGNRSLRDSPLLANGSVNSISDGGFVGLFVWGLVGIGVDVSVGNTYAFVPEASALDVAVLNNQSLYQHANSGYSNFPTRLQRFMTQAPETISGQTIHNGEHPFPFRRRLAIWIFREMEPTIIIPNFNYGNEFCNRPCLPPIPNYGVKGTICVGESNPIYLDAPQSMSAIWNTSPELSVVYQNGMPHLVWNGTGGNGYGWIEPVLLTNAECTLPLPRQNVWKGNPPTSYTLIAPYKKASGIYIFCPNQTAKFTFQIPNNNTAGIQRYECMVDGCVVTQETTDNGDRTELTFTVVNLNDFDKCLGSVSVRAVNDCGEGDWEAIPFVVTPLCNVGLKGSPCPPNVASDRLSTEAFENPFGNTGFRFRLSNLPWVDYNRVNDTTPAEFDYTVQVFDNQGDLKRQIQTNTVQTYIDMANLPTGNYYVRAVFQNGAYTSNKTVVKQ
jgi:hypothetical protein